MRHNVNIPALAVGILFLTFIAYEIAGGSDLFPQLHTVSYLAQQHPLLKWFLFVAPPAIYQIWWLWHMSGVIPK